MKGVVIRIVIIGVVMVMLEGYVIGGGELVTKEDFKIFVEAFNKRTEMILWVMGIGFGGLASFILFVFRVLQKQMAERFEKVAERFAKVEERFARIEERFEKVDERFEEVMSVLLLLVKAHEREIGGDVIKVTLGKMNMKDIADELKEGFTKRVKEAEKEKLKEYLRDKEIIEILAKELKERIKEDSIAA